LIQVAELLHSTIPNVKKAFDIIKSLENGFDTENDGLSYLRQVIAAQVLRNPDYVDANVDDAGLGDSDQASFLMKRVVGLICQEGRGIPPCIDSSDPVVIRAGLGEYYERVSQSAPRPLINSANRERRDFVWDLQSIGPFNIVYMLMGGAPGSATTPDELVEDALSFFDDARKHGIEPRQIFFDTTVIPLAMEFSRFQEPGFNFVSIETLRRVMHHEELKGVNSILGITNLTRDFPAGRKIGLLRAYVQIAMDAGLTAAIVDVRRQFGLRAADDEEIVEIVKAFVEQDGSPEAYERMTKAYEKYKSYGVKKRLRARV
jgi:cobalamin-dependent methionine synthase I